MPLSSGEQRRFSPHQRKVHHAAQAALPPPLPPGQRRRRGRDAYRYEHAALRPGAQAAERHLIQRALANNDFSRARAAKALGVSRVTLYKKLKKHGLMEERRLLPPTD